MERSIDRRKNPGRTETKIRTTVSLDDDLVAPAPELTGLKETSTLIREALMGRVARASAGRLILLGGSQPDAAYIPRRRPKKVSG